MFKKIISLTLISSALSFSTATMANDWFVSAHAGKAFQKTDFNAAQENIDGYDINNEPPILGLSGGLFINNNMRVYASIEGGKDSDRFEIRNTRDKAKINNLGFSLSADYVHNVPSLSSTQFFVGGTVGYNEMKAELETEWPSGRRESDSNKDRAMNYGLQLGLIQTFNQNFSAELGYRYKIMNNSVKLFDDDVEIKQKNQQLAYVGLTYRF